MRLSIASGGVIAWLITKGNVVSAQRAQARVAELHE
jgi:hypothetical protein